MPGIVAGQHRSNACSVPFQPEETYRYRMPLFTKGLTPRYLFRLVATRTTNTVGKKSAPTRETAVVATSNQSEEDIFHLEPQRAANRLLGHLLWQCNQGSECNLMSWTSSLLFTLNYALYRHHNNGDALGSINLVILDTRDFPEGTFVQDMEIIRALSGENAELGKFLEFREQDHYFGEYLTQGKLDIEGRCACTSIQRMVNFGLFQLQPGLDDATQWKLWPKKVLEFRDQFMSCKNIPTTETDVTIAVNIAKQCLGHAWTIPGALMLLALQPRNSNDMAIVQGFKARFTRREIEYASLSDIQIDDRRLPEVGQFKVLVNLIDHHYSNSDVDGLLGSMQRMGF